LTLTAHWTQELKLVLRKKTWCRCCGMNIPWVISTIISLEP